MKVLFLSNNTNSFGLLEWLIEQNIEVIFFNSRLSEDYLKAVDPVLIISFNYKYIIKKEILNLYPNRFINLHTSYLPYNRGANPNVWSFLEDTSKGVTIHLIDEGIDTGDIIFQKELIFDTSKESLASSYKILINSLTELFINNWDLISNLKYNSIKQTNTGSVHYLKDYEKIKDLLYPEGFNIKIDELIKRYKNLHNGS